MPLPACFGLRLHVGWHSRACCLSRALHAERVVPSAVPVRLSWLSSSKLCGASACTRCSCCPAAPHALRAPRRLSRPSNSELCGRISMFLVQLLPLLDRSGLNVQGSFNDSHSTPVEEVPEVSPQRVTKTPISRVAAQLQGPESTACPSMAPEWCPSCASMRQHSLHGPLQRCE